MEMREMLGRLAKIEKILIARLECIIPIWHGKQIIPNVMQFVEKIYLLDNGCIILEGYMKENDYLTTYMDINEQIKYLELCKDKENKAIKYYIDYFNEAKEKLKSF